MTVLQNDILEMYNSLVMFSDNIVKTKFPAPIKVWYEKDSRLLVFENKGKTARLYLPIYYCLDLNTLSEKNYTYLLPEGYIYLMDTLKNLIGSGALIKDRTCVSPIPFGFDVYSTDIKELWKGPDLLGRVRFVSGKGFLFRFITKRKYDL